MTPARRGGRRYPLLLYTRMMDRWWPAMFLIGVGMLALGWPFYSDVYTRLTEPWRYRLALIVGVMAILTSLLLLAFRHGAYVQPFPDYLRLATPFLRMNISCRRIQRTTPVGMNALFPRRSLRGLKRDILEPLFGYTAVVLDLNALPIPRRVLGFFLSPFFFKFKDETPHIVILVRDWMRFSSELDGMCRSPVPMGQLSRRPSSILSSLPPR